LILVKVKAGRDRRTEGAGAITPAGGTLGGGKRAAAAISRRLYGGPRLGGGLDPVRDPTGQNQKKL